MSNLTVSATNGKPVNLRKQPTKASSIVTTVPVGKEVTLLEKTSNEWYKIQYGLFEGYMMAQYLKFNDSISQVDLRKVYDALREALDMIEILMK